MNRPALSVVVPPAGQCYHLVGRLITALSTEFKSEVFPPHFTLQTLYHPVVEREVIAVVKRIALETEAFEARTNGVGMLDAIFDPGVRYLYLRVVKTRALARLYQRLRTNLRAIGATTYPYTAREWTPHLTIASGRWTPAEADKIQANLVSLAPTYNDYQCQFLVRTLEVHRREANGEWKLLIEVPLVRPRAPSERNRSSDADINACGQGRERGDRK